jgi:urease accessory protein
MMQPSFFRVLQLASPALPVGAYSYSQGLEMAVELGWVADEETALRWVGDALEWNMSQWELPLLGCLVEAWQARIAGQGDGALIARWNSEFLASRETAEFRLETVQMGFSTMKLLKDLYSDSPERTVVERDCILMQELTFPVAWSALAALGGIDKRTAMMAYLWAWMENQVMAAVKLVPLGQSAGQRLLKALGERVSQRVERAYYLPEEAWSNYALGLSLVSSRHETQYSRLFRS